MDEMEVIVTASYHKRKRKYIYVQCKGR